MFACKFSHILNLFEISVIHSTTENNTLHGKIAISLHQRFCKLNKVKTLRQNMQNKINLTVNLFISLAQMQMGCIFFCIRRPRNDTDDVIHIVTATMATDLHVVLINNNTLYIFYNN